MSIIVKHKPKVKLTTSRWIKSIAMFEKYSKEEVRASRLKKKWHRKVKYYTKKYSNT